MKSFPRNGNPRASINAAINGAWFSVPMQIAPGRGATLFSIPAFDTLASAINSIWVRHARRRGTGREQRLGQLCRIMLQCILVAVSHSFFFGPKSNRGLIALISLHISRIVLPPGHALPSPFPPYSNCLACLSALLVPGTKRSRALRLPCLAQLVHVDDIIVCLTIYTNYPPNVWRLHHQCNNPQRRRKDEALNNLSPSAGFIDMRQVDTSIIIFIGSLTFRIVFSIRWWTQ